MDKTKIFPCALMILDIGSSIMCFTASDTRKAIYWIAAAVLTATVTF